MKAILKFDLNEDMYDYNMHIQALGMYSALHEMQQFLRGKTKYADDSMSDEALNAYEECMEYFNGVLADNQVNLDL